jgi:hypothetical protein
MTAATLKATVVKKPKTFCSRTSAECMVAKSGRLHVRSSYREGALRESMAVAWESRSVESGWIGGPNT